jgi:hypothetical protein
MFYDYSLYDYDVRVRNRLQLNKPSLYRIDNNINHSIYINHLPREKINKYKKK